VQYNKIITLDGTRLRVEPLDLDGDGVTGEVETVRPNFGGDVTTINSPSELGETLRELNKDEIESNTGMTGIDMKSRLHYIEVSSILAMDALVALKVLPRRCLAFTRQKKRLAVSLDGKGRQEMVEVVGRKREQDKAVANAGGGGIGQGIRNFVGL
jgi:hypothetical protein